MKRTVFFDPPEDAWALLWEEMPEKFALLGKTYSSRKSLSRPSKECMVLRKLLFYGI